MLPDHCRDAGGFKGLEHFGFYTKALLASTVQHRRYLLQCASRRSSDFRQSHIFTPMQMVEFIIYLAFW